MSRQDAAELIKATKVSSSEGASGDGMHTCMYCMSCLITCMYVCMYVCMSCMYVVNALGYEQSAKIVLYVCM